MATRRQRRDQAEHDTGVLTEEQEAELLAAREEALSSRSPAARARYDQRWDEFLADGRESVTHGDEGIGLEPGHSGLSGV